MRINVITTIEIDEEIKTWDDVSKVYDEFKEIIKNAHESKDLTDFSFVDSDTMEEIESQVEE